jgi:hypothetical protein
MTTEKFKNAVQTAKNKPMGVIVSVDLFSALDAETLLVRKLATPWGNHAPLLGLEFPYYDTDVYLACDPAMDNFNFKLPPI